MTEAGVPARRHPRRATRAVAGIAAAAGLLLATACTDATEPGATPPVESAPPPLATVTVPDRCEPAPLDAPGFAPGGWWAFIGAEQLAVDLDGMAAVGARWLRVGFQWSSIEPRPGEFEWDVWDDVVRLAAARCIDIIGMPTYTAEWARSAECAAEFACVPRDSNDYARFVAALVSRYGATIDAWELWNEPNVAQFFGPVPDARAYAELLQAGAAAVAAYDPEATIISGGLAPVRSTGDGRRIDPRTFLAEVHEAGGLDGVDAIGFHPYGFPDAPDVSTGQNGWADMLPDIEAMLDEWGMEDRRIWLTEFGIATGGSSAAVSRDDQAAVVETAFELWRSSDRYGPLIWYAYRNAGDDLGNLEDNFGLLDRSGVPKPALSVFADLATSN